MLFLPTSLVTYAALVTHHWLDVGPFAASTDPYELPAQVRQLRVYGARTMPALVTSACPLLSASLAGLLLSMWPVAAQMRVACTALRQLMPTCDDLAGGGAVCSLVECGRLAGHLHRVAAVHLSTGRVSCVYLVAVLWESATVQPCIGAVTLSAPPAYPCLCC